MKRRSPRRRIVRPAAAAVPAKMRAPFSKQAVPRPRLYREVDQSAAPLQWICAPAGAGKSLGAAGYLAACKRVGIWYEVDAEDRDPATLVAHLAKTLAGPGRATSSVKLVPVHPEALRKQAELLFGKLLSGRRDRRRPLLLVLDNYQEADDSPAWNDLVAGLASAWASSAPRASRILVTSRRRPPARLARMVAEGSIAVLDADLLRFDEAEMRCMLRVRRPTDRKRPRERGSEVTHARKLLAQSGGWAVAAVLLARPDHAPAAPGERVASRDVEPFFDYLTAEIARHLPDQARRALVRLAFVHRISVATVGTLAPWIDFDVLVTELDRVALPFSRDADGAIRLHDLVREYLRKRLVAGLDSGERAQLLTASARLLSDEGHLQEAASLCREAGAWEDLTALLCTHAPALVAAGRAVTVSAAPDALPTDRIEKNPWLGLWRAVCGLPHDAALAQQRLVAVVEQFRSAGDVVGRSLAAACAIQAIVLRGDDLRATLPLLQVLDEPLPSLLPPPIAVRVLASRLLALTFLEAGSLASQRAADQALALPPDPTQVADAIASCGFAMIVYMNAGRPDDADAARRRARALGRSAPHDPVAQLGYLHAEAWFTAAQVSPWESLRSAEEGLALAELSGISVWRAQLAGMGCMMALRCGDVPSAAALLATMEDSAQMVASRYLRAAYLSTRGDYKMALGQMEGVLADFRSSKECEVTAGFTYGHFYCATIEMLLLAVLGRWEEIPSVRFELDSILDRFHPPLLEAARDLAEAIVELLAHGLFAAHLPLKKALARARLARHGDIPSKAHCYRPCGRCLRVGDRTRLRHRACPWLPARSTCRRHRPSVAMAVRGSPARLIFACGRRASI